MHLSIRTSLSVRELLIWLALALVVVLGGWHLFIIGGADNSPLLRQALRVESSTIVPVSRPDIVRVSILVTVANTGTQTITLRPGDFALVSGQGDVLGRAGVPQPSDAFSGAIAPGGVRTGLLTFLTPAAGLSQAYLLYHPDQGNVIFYAHLTFAATLPSQTILTTITEHPLNDGAGMPWGMAVDAAGDIWFAEPGCNFTPICPSDTPPGQLGEFVAGAHTVNFYTLPDIAGNQPLFVALDGAGNVWFTTPDNSMIGEFDPRTRRFVGQWPVIPDSGPWDLTFNKGVIWYTEYFISGIGEFNPQTHTYRDFATPTLNSHPYGIAGGDPVNDNLIWFTENNSSVARIGVLDTASGHIAEYPIRARSASELTPHLLALDYRGDPWWTEGFMRAIGTLDPAVAVPGRCGTSHGDCRGVREFPLPPAPHSCPHSHVSGIAIQDKQFIWIDDSGSGQVGNYNVATHQFTLYDLGSCEAHPYDGLVLGPDRHIWWDEQFANALGELIQ